jgi:asparagine synthetase B (glutamine-hydrolysing)
VGAAFSGGVDSSANVTAMCQLSGAGLDLHTFSYIADDPASARNAGCSSSRATGSRAHRRDRAARAALTGPPHRDPGRAVRRHEYLCAVPRLPARPRSRDQGDARRPRADELFAGYATTFLTVSPAFASAATSPPLAVGAPRACPRSRRHAARAVATRPRDAAQGCAPTHQPARARMARRAVGSVTRYQPRRPGAHAQRKPRQYRLDTVHRYGTAPLRGLQPMVSSVESRVPFLTPALAEFGARCRTRP